MQASETGSQAESGNSSEGAINKILKVRNSFLAVVLGGDVRMEVALGLALKDRCAYHLSGEVDKHPPAERQNDGRVLECLGME